MAYNEWKAECSFTMQLGVGKKHPGDSSNSWPFLYPQSLEVTNNFWVQVTFFTHHPKKGHQHTELPGWFCLCQKKDFWSSWIRLFGDFLYFLSWDSSPLNHRLRNMFFTHLKQIQEFLKCQRRDGLWPFITDGPWVSVSGALFVTSICCWWFRNPEKLTSWGW